MATIIEEKSSPMRLLHQWYQIITCDGFQRQLEDCHGNWRTNLEPSGKVPKQNYLLEIHV